MKTFFSKIKSKIFEVDLYKNRFFLIGGSIFLVILIGGIILFTTLLKAPEPQSREEAVFTVSLKATEPDIINKLKSQGFIRNVQTFNLALTVKGKHGKIEPGGYMLSKNLNVWQVLEKVTSPPSMKWVVIPEGLRKEEIGEILAKTFNWSSDDLDKWDNVYTAMDFDHLEGTYFPDTYLIPVKESGLDIAKRMINHFNEKFDPYIGQFAKQNIVWTTGLRLASVVQREAGGKQDMPLIAGIFWNRLLKNMNLEVDSTVQYARGETDSGWWAPVSSEDIRNIDSPYNTYKNSGLPPHPICNPGIDAIEAVLNPAETNCLFFLHDKQRQIHCAETLEEHQANIEKYLR